jgi:hypothetical protein
MTSNKNSNVTDKNKKTSEEPKSHYVSYSKSTQASSVYQKSSEGEFSQSEVKTKEVLDK